MLLLMMAIAIPSFIFTKTNKYHWCESPVYIEMGHGTGKSSLNVNSWVHRQVRLGQAGLVHLQMLICLIMMMMMLRRRIRKRKGSPRSPLLTSGINSLFETPCGRAYLCGRRESLSHKHLIYKQMFDLRVLIYLQQFRQNLKGVWKSTRATAPGISN